MRTITHWIGGKPTGEDAIRFGDVMDPSTGQVQARVAFATGEVVDAAVRAAHDAFRHWRDVSVSRRVQVLFGFRELFAARADHLARLVASEHGKVVSDARGEVQRGQEVLEYVCGIAELTKGEFNQNVSTRVDSYSMRQPLGVCVGVTPFNFPAMVPMWMYPVAIACGNTFVLKPSEKDPSAANLMAELFAEAGLPDGVFNVVHGDREVVDALLGHPDVAAVSFVGSTPIARSVYERGTAAGRRVQALGGAKNHAVVLPDADLDVAADELTSAAYGSAGERCMAISAVVAVDAVGDDLVDRLRDRAESVTVGPSLDADSEMGPLVTGAHHDRVAGYIDRGVDEGAMLVVDGRGLRVDDHEDGYFLGPCLFDHVTTDMAIYTDEIFGPVLVVLRVETFDDAIALINDNAYGNGTAIFTNDGGAARAFEHRIEVGMVGVNVPIPVPMAYHSFGGWKDSLFGDLGVHGPDGVRFYTRSKKITRRWPEPAERGVDLGFPTAR